VETTAEPVEDGGWILNGEKLWCTNGTVADHVVVLARTPNKRGITAFIVPTDDPGMELTQRCRFMGMNGMESAAFRLTDVKVPAENMIWEEGKGLKLALVTLNAGRLTIPAMAAGTTRECVRWCREWAAERVQWGQPVGKHDAVAQMIADVAAHAYAIESMCDLCGMLQDSGGYDIRLEAALAKLFCSEHGWRVVDETMQVLGGRGYETAASLKERGDPVRPIERMMRDFRVYRIFEGSSEILRLFIAREAVDRHLQVAGDLVQGKLGFFKKLAELPKVGWFYAKWYPSRWFGWGHWPKYGEQGKLATHVRFLDRTSRRLARAVFHKMARHGAKLERRQGILFRAVDIGAELFAMSAAVGRANMLKRTGSAEAERAERMADLFCRMSRRRVGELFRGLRGNDDVRRYRAARDVLAGQDTWLEGNRL
jgi:alkylation response protein AidB-like acyl-CoA dehydrogenase